VVLLGVDVVGVSDERPPRNALVLVADALAAAFRHRRLLRNRPLTKQSSVNPSISLTRLWKQVNEIYE
jgi:hypothetical protein